MSRAQQGSQSSWDDRCTNTQSERNIEEVVSNVAYRS